MKYHNISHCTATAALTSVLLFAAGCRSPQTVPEVASVEYSPTLEVVAESERQWTGVTVDPDERIFVCFPRWSDEVPFSVGEVLTGRVLPFPDNEWNDWQPGMNPAEHFICVQSVVVDDEGFLWVLDPANPRFEGVVPGGAKLIKFDTELAVPTKIITFSEKLVPKNSYLNDVRIDTRSDTAYITDSGAGALIVVDLTDQSARRILAGHESTKSESTIVEINGKMWNKNGDTLRDVHADGIALSPDGRQLYYHALTGSTLYRIATRHLRNADLSAQALEKKVQTLEKTGPVDGILMGPDGYLYLTALEKHAITRRTPAGTYETVVKSPRLRWPDTLSIGPDGFVYVTTSQIHLGQNPETPYGLYRFKPVP